MSKMLTEVVPTGMENQTPTGWVCPRCGKVNAPTEKSCPCSKEESAQPQPRKILNE